MITVATLPKPFIGHIGIIQRNAIQSWLQWKPRPRVILFGNEEGVADVAKEFGIDHVPHPKSNAYGTPYLDDVFATAQAMTEGDLLCYSNCDIILLSDFAPSVERARKAADRFLLVGECVNLDVKTSIDFDALEWEEKLRGFMHAKGTRRGINADYFLFTKDLYPKPPKMILGRAYFDNWAIWEARRLGVPVIDATGQITAIHQNHYYAAVAGETVQSHNGIEAQENLDVLGGKPNVYWITDRTHRLTASGLQRDWEATLMLKRRWNGIVKKTKYAILDSLQALGLRS